MTPSIVWLPQTDLVVEVHKSEKREVLYYRIGKVCKKDKKIDWGSSRDYDTGIAPRVSGACLANGEINLIEVHQSETRMKMYYRIGKLLKAEGGCDTEKSFMLEWGSSNKYDSGVLPSIAMNDKVAVAVHKSENYDKMYYHSALLPQAVTIAEGSSSSSKPAVVSESDEVKILKED